MFEPQAKAQLPVIRLPVIKLVSGFDRLGEVTLVPNKIIHDYLEAPK